MLREIAILKIDTLFELMCTTGTQDLTEIRYNKLCGYLSMAHALGLITRKEQYFIISAAVEAVIDVIF